MVCEKKGGFLKLWCNCCYYLGTDFDKKSATRMRYEKLIIPITLFISMAYGFSMIFTL
jgi:hypothetical protein